MGSINTIKSKPEIKPLRVEVVRNRVQLMRGGIHNAGIVGESSTNLAGTFELPDIISDLQDETGLTRRTIVDILIGSNRLNDFLKNPYDYIQIVKNSIKEVLAKTVIEGVQYEKLPGEVYELRELQSDSQKEEERFILEMTNFTK